MRYKSSETMEQIRKFAEKFFIEHKRSPSTAEIAEEIGIVRSTVYKYLVHMNERGILSYDGRDISTAVTQKVDTETTQAAIAGSVSCGLPQDEEERIEAYVSLPVSMFGRGEFYILRANGDSMIDAGIDDGDLIVIKRQKTARDGDIVVALVDNQNLLKRYYADQERKCICLHAENDAYEDRYVKECDIQGVAKHVIKAL